MFVEAVNQLGKQVGYPMMSPRDRDILNEFSDRVRQQFPDAQIWAFGSRARGDAHSDSDFDICVVIETLNDKTWKALSEIAWSVGFEHEVLITTIKFSRQKFEQSPCTASPLVRNILREGIAA